MIPTGVTKGSDVYCRNALFGFCIAATLAADVLADPSTYFKISVIDEQTGRGVPLVELRTTNEVEHITDSAGVVAFHEPGLMGQEVYFHVRSHGYEAPKDGFGFRGVRLRPTAGGSAVVKVKRLNVAERLYRVTGQGVYRDSVLVGDRAPTREPVLNAQVMGQDSVHAALYRRKVFWIWGDTNRASYPLGNFGVAAATSDPPRATGATGGPDPASGVDLRYFVDDKGFARPMVPADAVPGPGPKWLGGLATVRDDAGAERLIAKYERVKDLAVTLERGLAIYNDTKQSFDRLAQFDLAAPLYLDGHPFRVRVGGGAEYLYCGYSAPYSVRVRAVLADISNPAAYEGFTCLAPGSRYDKAASRLDRAADGKLRYSWKRDTPPLSHEQQAELIAAGQLKPDEAWLQLRDIETGKPVRPHAGSVCWNEYRQRWVMIVEESGGTSLLGEVWFAEADTPVGPWVYARKIVTHEKYSFYNPTQHAFLDQDGGRTIYFEGTYSDLFSGSRQKTPRYDYNQIMYRLRLDDPRLALPAPVYRVKAAGGAVQLMMRDGVESAGAWDRVEGVAFFAVPPQRPHDGLVAVYASDEGGATRLRAAPARSPEQKPLFFAVPSAPADPPSHKSDAVVALFEYDGGPQRGATYATSPANSGAGRTVCRVWTSPIAVRALDPDARPITPTE